jgi:hypothetical protein
MRDAKGIFVVVPLPITRPVLRPDQPNSGSRVDHFKSDVFLAGHKILPSLAKPTRDGTTFSRSDDPGDAYGQCVPPVNHERIRNMERRLEHPVEA